MRDISIPIQIDSTKQMGDYQKTRCSYFRIEITRRNQTFFGPVSMAFDNEFTASYWGNWAILTGPGMTEETDGLFLTPDLIERTFTFIEDNESFLLDVAYIWLPNQMILIGDNAETKRGDVYRLSIQLFHLCYLLVVDVINEKEWFESCMSMTEDIQPSPQETAAFRRWRIEQIQSASNRYHAPAYAERRLQKKES